ncbi:unnamed protein product [Arctia plantaginis]|uniref:Uncharacterized protein n=1 Tax=Arctia plantaginis TaxID=874455 RepID=A0A8S1ASM4_ARCPL|nr:unnamed protein product [Arctia plantaginis]
MTVSTKVTPVADHKKNVFPFPPSNCLPGQHKRTGGTRTTFAYVMDKTKALLRPTVRASAILVSIVINANEH